MFDSMRLVFACDGRSLSSQRLLDESDVAYERRGNSNDMVDADDSARLFSTERVTVVVDVDMRDLPGLLSPTRTVNDEQYSE